MSRKTVALALMFLVISFAELAAEPREDAVESFVRLAAKNQTLDFVIENFPKNSPNDLNFDITVTVPEKIAEVVVTFSDRQKGTVETLAELKFVWKDLSKDELAGNKPIKLILRKAEIFK